MTILSQRYLVPLNRAALMSQIQHLVGLGYFYWHAGSVHVDKACGLLDKFVSLYPILATPSVRATNKRKAIANVNLLWGVAESQPDRVGWILLATKGKGDGPFPDTIHQRERMKDARITPVLWGAHYMMHLRVMADSQDPEEKRKKRSMRPRWTWSMTQPTYGGWRDQIVQAAQQGDREYQNTFSHLVPSPMFGGIRADLRTLEREGFSVWKKCHRNAAYRSPLPMPLPFMPRIPVYGDLTLWALVEQIRKRVDTAARDAAVQAVAATSLQP